MKRFNKDEVLVYDIFGLCMVKEIKSMSFIKTEPKQDYYVLSPLSGSSTVYYVPVNSEKALTKLRRPLTKAELDNLLSESAEKELEWIENRQLRSESFRNVFEKGITPELVSLIKCIYSHKTVLSERGKKLSANDETVFSGAERLLNEEFAFVLGIEKDQVREYIGRYFSCGQ